MFVVGATAGHALGQSGSLSARHALADGRWMLKGNGGLAFAGVEIRLQVRVQLVVRRAHIVSGSGPIADQWSGSINGQPFNGSCTGQFRVRGSALEPHAYVVAYRCVNNGKPSSGSSTGSLTDNVGITNLRGSCDRMTASLVEPAKISRGEKTWGGWVATRQPGSGPAC
jgi:hypothetical protein